jgi:antitoxin (DNA-binding transcriptional repressor) of toxin-antitoxin stability system
MKVIDLNEAKANLERYAEECQTSPVIVTLDGRPVFELTPIRDDDDDPDFMNRLLEHNPEFRRMLEERRREVEQGKVSTLAEVRARLLAEPTE